LLDNIKIAFFFIVVFLSLSVNLPDSMVGRLGFDANYVFVACVAMMFSFMIAQRRVIVFILAACLAIIANMPEGVVAEYGVDRDFAAGLLIALLFTPFILDCLE